VLTLSGWLPVKVRHLCGALVIADGINRHAEVHRAVARRVVDANRTRSPATAGDSHGRAAGALRFSGPRVATRRSYACRVNFVDVGRHAAVDACGPGVA
jgi:hypothetical protein